MRKTELKINLSNLNHNIDVIQKYTNADIQAVVKANSYGLSASEVAKTIENKVESFSVITLDEALDLRKHTDKPILLLQGVHEQNDYDLIQNYKLDFVVHSKWQLENISNFNLKDSRLWLKINTGMNRLGLDLDEFHDTFNTVKGLETKDIILMSHLAASSVKEDKQTKEQIEIFSQTTNSLKFKKSLANSGAIFNFSEAHHDIVRPGIAIYGGKYNEFGTKNVSSLSSEIISIRPVKAGTKVGYDGSWVAEKDCLIGSIPIGYGDGLPYFTNPVTVKINGRNFKTAGKANMDLIMINLEQDNTIKIGDTVQIWDFDSDLSELSEEFNTITYNLLANISGRVPKNYLE
jgi:alanine racemase